MKKTLLCFQGKIAFTIAFMLYLGEFWKDSPYAWLLQSLKSFCMDFKLLILLIKSLSVVLLINALQHYVLSILYILPPFYLCIMFLIDNHPYKILDNIYKRHGQSMCCFILHVLMYDWHAIHKLGRVGFTLNPKLHHNCSKLYLC